MRLLGISTPYETATSRGAKLGLSEQNPQPTGSRWFCTRTMLGALGKKKKKQNPMFHHTDPRTICRISPIRLKTKASRSRLILEAASGAQWGCTPRDSVSACRKICADILPVLTPKYDTGLEKTLNRGRVCTWVCVLEWGVRLQTWSSAHLLDFL